MDIATLKLHGYIVQSQELEICSSPGHMKSSIVHRPNCFNKLLLESAYSL